MNTEYFKTSRGSGSSAVVGFLVSAVVLFAAFQAGGAAPGCVPAPTGLVGWWRAEGNANDTAGGHHGALFNGVTFAAGTVGQAFSFDGTNAYVEVPDAPALRLTNELTIEFWVKRQRLTFPSYPYADYIVEKGGDTTGGVQNYGVALHNPAYNHCLHFTFAGGWRGAGSVADLNWHHCAVVARHGQADPTFYIDGVQQPVVYRQGAGTINLYPSTRPLHIGAQIDPVSRWYYYSKTLVDELALYNRALSASEIQSIYAAGSAGKCAPPPVCVPAPSGLISWWRGRKLNCGRDGRKSRNIAGTGIVTYGAGVVGQAFVFDGTHRDRVDLGNPTNLQLENFTLEAWVKRSSSTVTTFDILGADGSVCGDGACIIGYGRGGYIFALANDGRMILSRTDLDGLFSAPLVTDTNWHHLAVTKSGSSAVFYLDGVPQATPAYVHPDPYTFDDATCSCSAAIAIGSRGDARGGTFFGMIDEPAVFNRALSASEIQSIYSAGSAGKCAPNPPSTCVPPPLGLVSWWRSESNALDEMGGNSGTLAGNAAYGAGVAGQCFVLDGNRDGVCVGSNSSLQLQDLSIEGWIKRSSATQASFNGNGNGEIFVVGTYPGGCRFGIRQTDNHLEFGKPSGIQVSSAAQVADTNWHHVAVTRQGTQVVFYVDGVAYAAPTYTASSFSFSAPAYIGAWWNPYGQVDNSFYGAIDELAVYNRELTAAELQAIYAAGSAGKCAPGVAPSIITQPASQTVLAGSNATFTVTAAGTPPLELPVAFQWNQYCRGDCHLADPGQCAARPGGQLLGAGDQRLRLDHQLQCGADCNPCLDQLCSASSGSGQLVAGARATPVTQPTATTGRCAGDGLSPRARLGRPSGSTGQQLRGGSGFARPAVDQPVDHRVLGQAAGFAEGGLHQ